MGETSPLHQAFPERLGSYRVSRACVKTFSYVRYVKLRTRIYTVQSGMMRGDSLHVQAYIINWVGFLAVSW